MIYLHSNFPCGRTAHGKLGILHRRCQNFVFIFFVNKLNINKKEKSCCIIFALMRYFCLFDSFLGFCEFVILSPSN